MAFNAGSVFVRVGAELDRRGFEQFEHEVVKAQKVKDINTRLGAEVVDARQFDVYNKKLEETRQKVARRDAFKATLGADYNPAAFRAYERDIVRTQRANDDMVRSNGRLRTAFGSVWAGGGAAFAAVGGAYAVVSAVKGITKAYSESQVSQEKMKAQLKALGISFDDHAKQIDKVIQKVSQLSGLDDEDLQDSFTNIVRVTGDVDKSLRLTGLAADFARAKHVDLSTASNIVAKVAGGNTGILSRYGFVIDKGASSTEALAKLQEKFGGQAEAYGKTQQGALDRVGVAFENLQETLGTYLAPTLTKAANALAKFINQLQDGTGTGGKVIKIFKQIGGVIEDLMPVFKLLAKIVVATVQGMIDQVKGLVRIVKGIAEIVSGIAHGDWAKAWQGVRDVVGGTLKFIQGAIARATAPIRVVFGAIWSGISKPVTAAMHLVERTVGATLDKVIGGFTSVASVAESTLRVLGKAPGFGWATDAANDLRKLRGSLDSARESMRGWGKDSDNSSAKTRNLSERYNALVGQLSRTRKGSEDYRQKAGQVREVQDQLVRSVAGTGPASNTAVRAVRKLGTNYDSLRGSVGDAASTIVATTNNVLSGLGAKPVKFSLNAGSNIKTLGAGSPLLNPTGKARGGFAKEAGGWIGMPGEMGSDDVPIIVGRGEAVLNRHQQGVIEGMLGDGFLDNLFANVTTPHYLARGGRVPAFAAGGSVNAAVSKLGGELQNRFGLAVTSTTGGGHAANSYHYRGMAEDLGGSPAAMNAAASWLMSSGAYRNLLEGIHNPNLSVKNGQVVPPSFWGASTWGNHANHIHIALQALGAIAGGRGGLATQIAAPSISGPAGTLKTVLSAAVSKMTGAANKYVSGVSGSLGGGDRMDVPASGGGAKGGLSAGAARSAAAKALKIAGLPVTSENINSLVVLARKESSLVANVVNTTDVNAKAGNPSRGIMQVTESNFATYGPSGGNINNPVDNMVASIRYQLARYGRLITFSPYRKGGRAGARRFARGGKVGAAVGKAFSSGPGSVGAIVGSSGGTQAALTKIKPLQKTQAYGAKRYNAISDQITGLEHQYSLAERVYQRDDSDLIDETTGQINGDAIGQRLGEIDVLVKLRQQIESLYEQAATYARQVVDSIRQIISRLKASLGGAKGKDRSGIRQQIADYQDSLSTWAGADGLLAQASDNVDNSKQDLLDLFKERAGIAGTRAQDVTGSDTSSGGDAFDLSNLDGYGSDYGSVESPPTPEQIAQGVYDQLQSFNAAQAQTFSQFGSNFVPAGVSIGGGSDTSINAAGARYFGAVQGQDAGQGFASGPTIINNFAAPPPDPHTWTRTQQFILENV